MFQMASFLDFCHGHSAMQTDDIKNPLGSDCSLVPRDGHSPDAERTGECSIWTAPSDSTRLLNSQAMMPCLQAERRQERCILRA